MVGPSDFHSMASSSSSMIQRPAVKRTRHTWHGEPPYRSHFEDFMREIGVDAREHHLCCLPSQGTVSSRRRTKSASPPVRVDDGTGHTARLDFDRGRSRTREPAAQSNAGPPPTPKSPSALGLARLSVVAAAKAAGAVAKLKTHVVTAVYTQNHGASSHYPSVPAAGQLRFLMGDGMVSGPSQASYLSTTPADQEVWEQLPTSPAAIMSPKWPSVPSASPTSSSSSTRPPTRTFSRVPSFASLETISSSEGPQTPRGHSPVPLELPPSPPSREMQMSPTLEYIEHVSKMRVQALCVTCQKVGHNFPSCPTCGDTWCSRKCRVDGTGARGHTCQKVAEVPVDRPVTTAAT